MNRESITTFNKLIAKRIHQILFITELEIKGLAAITNRSTAIFYAVLSCKRPLSKKLALQIGNSLGFDGMLIFKLNTAIPAFIKNSACLAKFRQENSSNINYFRPSWSNEKDSTYIFTQLIEKGYFSELRFTWEITNKLVELGRNIPSDLLNKQLKYFVHKQILQSMRLPIKLKEGKFGKRLVHAYYK